MNRIRFLLITLSGMLFFLLFGTSCQKKEETPLPYQAAVATYAEIAFAAYDDGFLAAEALYLAIEDFLADPSAQRFDNCRKLWLAARLPYGQTEAYRFYGGPIDGVNGPEKRLNAWPIDESHIDYVAGNPSAGLINDPATYPDINRAVLTGLNQSISQTSVFTGFHAIEFLLWGQDLSTTGPGQRPFTDYVNGGTASNQERRGQYLRVIAELLVDDLAAVRNQWAPGGAYRTELINQTTTRVALGRIFTGLIELSGRELAEARLAAPLLSKNQQDETSRFSDNTHNDLRMNYQGLRNVYFGEYTKTDGTLITGTTLAEIGRRTDQSKSDATVAAFSKAQVDITNITSPFDQALINQGDQVQTAVESLQTLSERLREMGLALGAAL